MRRHTLLFCILLFALLLAGCAGMGSGEKRPNPELAAQHVASAQQLESQGDLPGALEQYKMALTADKTNATAKEASDRLSAKLSKMADERYELGMKYYRKGKYGLARKEFLTALKYVPDHPKASAMLVSKQPETAPKYVFHVVKPGESLSKIAKDYYGDFKKYTVIARFNHIEDVTVVKPGQRIMIPELDGMSLTQAASISADEKSTYVVHTLQRGESISKLAQMYYGDYKQFHIIARFNGMDDATRVSVGQKIKVPQVAGLPFRVPSKEQKPAAIPETKPIQEGQPVTEDETASQEPMEEQQEEPAGEVDEQILAYRDIGIELFNEGKYEDAVFELNKAIEAAPHDEKTKSYLARAYFESGKLLFDQHDFKAARDAFESAYQYDPNCDECLALVEKAKNGPLLMDRKKAVDLYNNKAYDKAIPALETYLQDRPSDNEVRKMLAKAYYEQALVSYNKGDFDAAKKGFEASLGYDSSCEKCAVYISKSLESFKEEHYNKGIVYFGKEDLADAITEWEKVYAVDPDYKDVTPNLNKARQLMEKLEQIKKSSK